MAIDLTSLLSALSPDGSPDQAGMAGVGNVVASTKQPFVPSSPQARQIEALQGLANSPSLARTGMGGALQPFAAYAAGQQENQAYTQQQQLRAMQQAALTQHYNSLASGDVDGALKALGAYAQAGGTPDELNKFNDTLKAGVNAQTTLNAQGVPVLTTQANAMSNNLTDAPAFNTRQNTLSEIQNRNFMQPVEQQKANAQSTDAAAKMGMVGVENNKLNWTMNENSPTAKAAAGDLKKLLDTSTSDADTARGNLAIINQLRPLIQNPVGPQLPGQVTTGPAAAQKLNYDLGANKWTLGLSGLDANDAALQNADILGKTLSTASLKGSYGGKVSNFEAKQGQAQGFAAANQPEVNATYLDRKQALMNGAIAHSQAIQTALAAGLPARSLTKFSTDWNAAHSNDLQNPYAAYPDPQAEVTAYVQNGGRFPTTSTSSPSSVIATKTIGGKTYHQVAGGDWHEGN